MKPVSRPSRSGKTSLADPVRALLRALRQHRFRLRVEVGLVIGLAVALFTSVALYFGLLSPLDPLSTGLVYQPIPPTGRVVIVLIDQKSIDQIGPWPWPRSVLAKLLERLSISPPRVVAVDLPLNLTSPEDGELADVIRSSGHVILSTALTETEQPKERPGEFPQFSDKIMPNPELRNAALGVGHSALTPDQDGVLRRIPVAIESNGSRLPALGLTAAQSFMQIPEMTFDLSHRRVLLGNVEIQTDEFGRMLLNFTSARAGVETFSFADVVFGRVQPSSLSGKIVVIGGSSATEQPEYLTPITSGGEMMPGVAVQAGLAEMLLNSPPRLLQRDDPIYQIAALLLVALIAGLTLPHLRPLSAAALTILYFLLVVFVAFEAFSHGVMLRVTYPGLALLLTFGTAATFRYLSEERRRQFLTILFRRYVPPESVAHVVDAADRGEVPLSGSRRKVTVMYADLRGFAGLTEGLAPEAVLALVNSYLELLLQEIHIENGTVNKPMGDALVAIWNAPLDQPDHAPRALRAAINIRRRIMRFEKSRGEEQAVNIGLGLATGYAVLGNISALGKVEYTLVGETVNIASRISTFAGKNQILADTATADAATEGIEKRELNPVRIRGRKDPLQVWEIKDVVEPVLEDSEDWLE